MSHTHLAKKLTPLKLWALMVGMVISGQYFGWSYGIAAAGSVFSFFVAAGLVVLFYIALTLSCAELACMMPLSGGPSAYAARAFGRPAAAIAGVACLLEFFCAVPAIALSLGGYTHLLFPGISAKVFAVGVVLMVLLINSFKIERMALIELVATIMALLGLLIFYGVGGAHITRSAIEGIAFNGRFSQVVSAIPFAIWLFLAIEGGVMTAEEMQDPRHTLLKGFGASLITLVVCTILTVFVTAVLSGQLASQTDSPLPAALMLLPGYWPNIAAKCVIVFGLFGLFASLNGITLAYSRQIYALSQAGFLPAFLARLSKNDVPFAALMLPGVLVLVLVLQSSMAKCLVIVSVLGAVVMYITIFLSLFRLRKCDGDAERVYRVPLVLAGSGLLLACCFLGAIVHSLLRQLL